MPAKDFFYKDFLRWLDVFCLKERKSGYELGEGYVYFYEIEA